MVANALEDPLLPGLYCIKRVGAFAGPEMNRAWTSKSFKGPLTDKVKRPDALSA